MSEEVKDIIVNSKAYNLTANAGLSYKFRMGCIDANLCPTDVENNWLAYPDAEQLIRHSNFRLEDLPSHSDVCICGHQIKNQFYITNPAGTQVEVVGSVCIEKFMKGKISSMRCDICNTGCHKNNHYLCKACRRIPKKQIIKCGCDRRMIKHPGITSCWKCTKLIKDIKKKKKEYAQEKKAMRDLIKSMKILKLLERVS